MTTEKQRCDRNDITLGFNGSCCHCLRCRNVAIRFRLWRNDGRPLRTTTVWTASAQARSQRRCFAGECSVRGSTDHCRRHICRRLGRRETTVCFHLKRCETAALRPVNDITSHQHKHYRHTSRWPHRKVHIYFTVVCHLTIIHKLLYICFPGKGVHAELV